MKILESEDLPIDRYKKDHEELALYASLSIKSNYCLLYCSCGALHFQSLLLMQMVSDICLGEGIFFLFLYSVYAGP